MPLRSCHELFAWPHAVLQMILWPGLDHNQDMVWEVHLRQMTKAGALVCADKSGMEGPREACRLVDYALRRDFLAMPEGPIFKWCCATCDRGLLQQRTRTSSDRTKCTRGLGYEVNMPPSEAGPVHAAALDLPVCVDAARHSQLETHRVARPGWYSCGFAFDAQDGCGAHRFTSCRISSFSSSSRLEMTNR